MASSHELGPKYESHNPLALDLASHRKAILSRCRELLDDGTDRDMLTIGDDSLTGHYIKKIVPFPNTSPDGEQEELLCDQLILTPRPLQPHSGVSEVKVFIPNSSTTTAELDMVIVKLITISGAEQTLLICPDGLVDFEEGSRLPITINPETLSFVPDESSDSNLVLTDDAEVNANLLYIFTKYRLRHHTTADLET